MRRVEDSIQNRDSVEQVAKAAVRDAVEGASDEEKETLARALYQEATGRFPQDSNDRRAVYIGGFCLLGGIFLVTGILVAVLGLKGYTFPEPMYVLATALGSGVLGGLFGYARQ